MAVVSFGEPSAPTSISFVQATRAIAIIKMANKYFFTFKIVFKNIVLKKSGFVALFYGFLFFICSERYKAELRRQPYKSA